MVETSAVKHITEDNVKDKPFVPRGCTTITHAKRDRPKTVSNAAQVGPAHRKLYFDSRSNKDPQLRALVAVQEHCARCLKHLTASRLAIDRDTRELVQTITEIYEPVRKDDCCGRGMRAEDSNRDAPTADQGELH